MLAERVPKRGFQLVYGFKSDYMIALKATMAKIFYGATVKVEYNSSACTYIP